MRSGFSNPKGITWRKTETETVTQRDKGIRREGSERQRQRRGREVTKKETATMLEGSERREKVTWVYMRIEQGCTSIKVRD